MRGSIEGFLVGLGSKDGSLGSLLREAFGDPAQLTLDVHSIFEFARGFGAGIRSVIETIRSVFGAMRSVFGGGDSNAYGQFVGKLLGFGALLTALAPAAIVIGALSKGVLGLVQVIVGAYRLVAGAGARRAGVAGLLVAQVALRARLRRAVASSASSAAPWASTASPRAPTPSVRFRPPPAIKRVVGFAVSSMCLIRNRLEDLRREPDQGQRRIHRLREAHCGRCGAIPEAPG